MFTLPKMMFRNKIIVLGLNLIHAMKVKKYFHRLENKIIVLGVTASVTCATFKIRKSR
jgi:hypothetical protein